MKNVIDRLVKYSKEIKLDEEYDYEFEISEAIFEPSEMEELEKIENLFERNVSLKKLLKEKYKTSSDTTKIDFWIINKWGKIIGFKENDVNVRKIKSFKNQLNSNKMSLDIFGTISSLSKISSFIDPDRFVIYDSRVIYALNYLILTSENQDGFKKKYYPIPSGRNKKITDFDMNTIINIFHINENVSTGDLFIPKQRAYFELCDFIRTNSENIFGLGAKPYELEMLLYTIADAEIFTDLKSKIRITID